MTLDRRNPYEITGDPDADFRRLQKKLNREQMTGDNPYAQKRMAENRAINEKTQQYLTEEQKAEGIANPDRNRFRFESIIDPDTGGPLNDYLDFPGYSNDLTSPDVYSYNDGVSFEMAEEARAEKENFAKPEQSMFANALQKDKLKNNPYITGDPDADFRRLQGNLVADQMMGDNPYANKRRAENRAINEKTQQYLTSEQKYQDVASADGFRYESVIDPDTGGPLGGGGSILDDTNPDFYSHNYGPEFSLAEESVERKANRPESSTQKDTRLRAEEYRRRIEENRARSRELGDKYRENADANPDRIENERNALEQRREEIRQEKFGKYNNRMGQPPVGQPPAGQPPAGQLPAGQPPTGQPPTGQPPSSNYYGSGKILDQPPDDYDSVLDGGDGIVIYLDEDSNAIGHTVGLPPDNWDSRLTYEDGRIEYLDQGGNIIGTQSGEGAPFIFTQPGSHTTPTGQPPADWKNKTRKDDGSIEYRDKDGNIIGTQSGEGAPFIFTQPGSNTPPTGQPPVTKPGLQPSYAPGSGQGGSTQVSGALTGNNYNLPLFEDPDSPGTYYPTPGQHYSNYGGAAFDPGMNESMDSFIDIARDSGMYNDTFKRFEDVQRAAKTLSRDQFGSDDQYNKAKFQVATKYGKLAAAVLDQTRPIMTARRKAAASAQGQHDDRVDLVMRQFGKLQDARDRDTTGYNQASDQDLMGKAIQNVLQGEYLRKTLGDDFGGNLTDEAARFSASQAFPTSEEAARPSATSRIDQPGTETNDPKVFNESYALGLDDYVTQTYENLPYNYGLNEKTGELGIFVDGYQPFKAIRVPGQILPVAMSRSEEEETLLKQAGVPFVRPGNPTEIINSHGDDDFKRETIEEQFDLETEIDNAIKDLSDESNTDFTSYENNLGAKSEYDKERAAFESRVKAENIPPDSPAYKAPEAPEYDPAPISDRILRARNKALEAEFESDLDGLRQQMEKGHIAISDFVPLSNELKRKLKNSKAAPLRREDIVFDDKQIQERVDLAKQNHERSQRVKTEQKRTANNDYGPQYSRAYERSIKNGQIVYKLLDTPRSFEPKKLLAYNPYGTDAARMPVAQSASDLASVAFDIPFLIYHEGELMPTELPRDVFDQAARDWRGDTKSIDGRIVDPLAQAVGNVTRLIEKYYPGELEEEQLMDAATQMMRRYGWQTDEEIRGYPSRPRNEEVVGNASRPRNEEYLVSADMGYAGTPALKATR